MRFHTVHPLQMSNQLRCEEILQGLALLTAFLVSDKDTLERSNDFQLANVNDIYRKVLNRIRI